VVQHSGYEYLIEMLIRVLEVRSIHYMKLALTVGLSGEFNALRLYIDAGVTIPGLDENGGKFAGATAQVQDTGYSTFSTGPL
jgi:hypothetical protein